MNWHQKYQKKRKEEKYANDTGTQLNFMRMRIYFTASHSLQCIRIYKVIAFKIKQNRELTIPTETEKSHTLSALI